MTRKRYNPRLALEEAGILEPELQKALDEVNAPADSPKGIMKALDEMEEEQVNEEQEVENEGSTEEAETEPANEEFEDPNIIHLEPEVEDDGTSSADEYLYVTEALSEMEKVRDQVDEASDDVETVMKVMETIEDSEATGGLDEAGAEFAEITLNDVARRQGIDTEDEAIIATESFSSPSARIHHGRIALEDIGQTVRRIITAIVEGVKKVVAMAKHFYKLVFDRAYKIRNEAVLMLSSMRKTTVDLAAMDATPIDGEYDKVSMIRYFEAGVNINLKYVSYILEEMRDVVRDAVEDINDTRKILFEADIMDVGKMDTLNISSCSLPSFMEKGVLKSYPPPTNMEAYHSSQSIAGGVLIAYIPRYRGDTMKHMKDIKWFMGADRSISNTPTSIPYLTFAQCEPVLKNILEVCKVVNGNKRAIEELQKAKDKLAVATSKVLASDWAVRQANKVAGKFGQDLRTEEGRMTVQFAKDAADAVRVIMNFYSKPVDAMNGLAVKMADAAIDYVKSSVKIRINTNLGTDKTL